MSSDSFGVEAALELVVEEAYSEIHHSLEDEICLDADDFCRQTAETFRSFDWKNCDSGREEAKLMLAAVDKRIA